MAAIDGRRPIKNAPFRIYFDLRQATNNHIAAGVTSPDSEFSLDGGSFADCTNEIVEVASSSGVYYLDATAAEMAADVVVFKVASTGAVTKAEVVRTEACLQSGEARGGGANTITLATSAVATDDYYNGAQVEIVRNTGAGQIRTISDYVGSSAIATVDRNWAVVPTSGSVYVVHSHVGARMNSRIRVEGSMKEINDDETAAELLEALYEGGLVKTTIDDSTPAADAFDLASGASATNDFYNNQWLIVTSGTLKGQAEKILDYAGSTRTVTLRAALPAVPVNGTSLVILGKVL